MEQNPSRDVTRKASPRRLPKAPQGREVAQRLLRNSSLQPVKRFDSADYFKDLWLLDQKEKQRERADGEEEEAGAPAACTPAQARGRAVSHPQPLWPISDLQIPPAPTGHGTWGMQDAHSVGGERRLAGL